MKKSRLYSIFMNKCPACHEGDYFIHRFTIHPNKFSKAHEVCKVCQHKFEKEPGFFYGAMYVSYALGVALAVATFLTLYVLFGVENYIVYIITIPLVLLLIAPINFRLSRLIWMNLFTGQKR